MHSWERLRLEAETQESLWEMTAASGDNRRELLQKSMFSEKRVKAKVMKN